MIAFQGGYKGFYSKNTISLTPKSVNGIHKRGGTILGTSRGGHNTSKIVDSIQHRGINQVGITDNRFGYFNDHNPFVLRWKDNVYLIVNTCS